MANKLSPVFNDAQFIDGIPAVGAKVFTYQAGSTTPLTTYADEAGTTPNANPVVLNSRGEPQQPFWLIEGQSYKFVFTASTDTDPPNSPIRTLDNIIGVGDNMITVSQWQSVGVTPTYINATTFTVAGDQTNVFTVGLRVKLNVTAGTVYGSITDSVYNGTSITTVTVLLDSGALDSGLSSVQIGLITPVNTSLPKIPNFVNNIMLENDVVNSRVMGDSTFGFALINGIITTSLSLNALTISVKTLAGTDPTATDPVLIYFRQSPLTSGGYVVRSIISALSVTISSGSTLGTVNAVASQINVMAIDNSGTVELAVVNNAGYLRLHEDDLISTTAEGGAGGADENNVVYSNAAIANVSYRNIAYIVSTQAVAGTWVTSPSKIQLLNAPQLRGVVYGEVVATTSGTTVSMPGIPPWVRNIDVILSGVSLSGTASQLLRIGDSGGIENTAYISNSSSIGAAVTTNNYTTGYGIITSAGAQAVSGVIMLRNISGNVWIASGTLSFDNTANTITAAGTKTLSDTLNQLQLANNGADTFDAGSATWTAW